MLAILLFACAPDPIRILDPVGSVGTEAIDVENDSEVVLTGFEFTDGDTVVALGDFEVGSGVRLRLALPGDATALIVHSDEQDWDFPLPPTTVRIVQ